MKKVIMHSTLLIMNWRIGGLAQLARASALHAEGQRFESVILHLWINNAILPVESQCLRLEKQQNQSDKRVARNKNILKFESLTEAN